MTCVCAACSGHPDPWVVHVQEMIRDGRLVHIGFDARDRPLFKVVD